MSNSTNLALPYVGPYQAQKHVTVNEAIRLLDGLVHLSVISKGLLAPPGSPVDGERYIVGSPASGAWAGWAGSIAYFADGAWVQLAPQAGWRAYVQDTGELFVHDGTDWRRALGLGTAPRRLEEDLTALSGATADTSIAFPAGSILLGVSTRVTTAITGASGFDVGLAATPAKFAAALPVALDSTNVGAVAPEVVAAATTIRLTAAGADFTGGSVRVALHFLSLDAPYS